MFDTLSLLTLQLARAYGVVILAVALAALLGSARLNAVIADFERSPGLTFLSALFALVLGLLLVMTHSHWGDVPAILVSALNWVILIKGLLLFAAPEGLLKVGAQASASPGMIRLWGVIALVLALVFLVIGFAGRATLSI